jgi:hypothetical protein
MIGKAWTRAAGAALAMAVAVAGGAQAKGAQGAEQALWAHLKGQASAQADGGYEHGFWRLVEENGRLADGVDVMDADPVCQCQDSGRAFQVKTVRAEPRRQVFRVLDPKDRTTKPWLVDMRLIGGKWRVWDVVDDRGSVRALLVSHNRCMRERKAKGLDVDRCM